MCQTDHSILPKRTIAAAECSEIFFKFWSILQLQPGYQRFVPAVFPNIEAGKTGWALGCRKDIITEFKRDLYLFTGWKHSNCPRRFQGWKGIGARSFQNPQAFCQFTLTTPQSMFHQWTINGYCGNLKLNMEHPWKSQCSRGNYKNIMCT